MKNVRIVVEIYIYIYIYYWNIETIKRRTRKRIVPESVTEFIHDTNHVPEGLTYVCRSCSASRTYVSARVYA